ncbi:hypothetical protein JCM8547_003272 [Rhodosporidiobolus lusitaniae]
MGLAYFAATCDAEQTMTAATIWCVAKEGICCSVCPNTMSSIGTRVGLTFTVFFATAVTVVDAAEAPFIFMTTCLQALAYILTILQQGLFGSGISRFHAYYGLYCSLGFLCPLAAASATANHFLYGKSHPKSGVRLLDMRTDLKRDPSAVSPSGHRAPHSLPKSRRDYLHLDSPSVPHGGLTSFTMRSLGASPFFSSGSHRTGREILRPLNETDPWNREVSSSAENSPYLRPDDGRLGKRHVRRNSIQDEEATIGTPPIRATPSALLAPAQPPSPHSHPSPRPSIRRSPRFEGRPSPRIIAEPDDLPDLPPLPAPAIPEPSPAPLRQRKKLTKPRPEEALLERQDSNRSVQTVYTRAELQKIERATKGGAWRKWGMLAANVALAVLWLVSYLLVHEYVGSFTLIQTDCEDPDGTSILKIAASVFLGISVFIFFVFLLNFYTQWLSKHLRRVFDYSRSANRWTRLAVPAIFSGLIFALWVTLLWTSYELAAQPDSSLLATTEESATFPTVLSIALTIKPICDLIKAFFKSYKRNQRERKDKRKEEKQNANSPLGTQQRRNSGARSVGDGSLRRRPSMGSTGPTNLDGGANDEEDEPEDEHLHHSRSSSLSSVPTSQRSSPLSDSASDREHGRRRKRG